MIKNLQKFTSKRVGHSTSGILIDPKCIVATDSFKLVRIEQDTGVASPVIVKLPRGLNTFDRVNQLNPGIVEIIKGDARFGCKVIDGIFPQYEKVLEEKTPIVSIRINPQFLRDVAIAFGKAASVDMSIYDGMKAIRFTNLDGSITALLMPMTK